MCVCVCVCVKGRALEGWWTVELLVWVYWVKIPILRPLLQSALKHSTHIHTHTRTHTPPPKVKGLFQTQRVNVNQFAIFSLPQTATSQPAITILCCILQEEWEGRGAQRKTICVCAFPVPHNHSHRLSKQNSSINKITLYHVRYDKSLTNKTSVAALFLKPFLARRMLYINIHSYINVYPIYSASRIKLASPLLCTA